MYEQACHVPQTSELQVAGVDSLSKEADIWSFGVSVFAVIFNEEVPYLTSIDSVFPDATLEEVNNYFERVMRRDLESRVEDLYPLYEEDEEEMRDALHRSIMDKCLTVEPSERSWPMFDVPQAEEIYAIICQMETEDEQDDGEEEED